jgi:hypothetical protein
LKPFPRLIALDVPDNDIKTLESDVFKFNTKLNNLFFARNKIFKVGRNVLAPLEKSELVAVFSYNVCINKYGDTPQSIAILQDALNSNCNSSEITECY